MKWYSPILFPVILSILAIFCWSSRSLCAGAALAKVSDTHFVAIDLAHVQIASRGVEPSPFILWRDALTQTHGLQIITLNSQSGAQRGNRLNVDLLKSWQPVEVLRARHFGNSPTKGIEPSPWIVCRDFRLYTIPVTYGPDGTPSAGGAATYTPAVDSGTYGSAVCAAELPGTEFTDGKARLFVGTDHGYIVVMLFTLSGGIAVTDYLPISAVSIVSLQPLPQYGYIVLGALTGNFIKGIRYYPNTPTPFSVQFTISLAHSPAFLDFDSFGPDDSVLSNPQGLLRLILADGSTDLSLASIAANQAGIVTPIAIRDSHAWEIRAVVTGSLLMLAGDQTSVAFDPGYSALTGSSGCDLNISDGVADQCSFICGDANADGNVDISDAVFLIQYIFAGGPSPNPPATGDANCDASVDISDPVYLIQYIFSGGPAPCALCI